MTSIPMQSNETSLSSNGHNGTCGLAGWLTSWHLSTTCTSGAHQPKYLANRIEPLYALDFSHGPAARSSLASITAVFRSSGRWQQTQQPVASGRPSMKTPRDARGKVRATVCASPSSSGSNLGSHSFSGQLQASAVAWSVSKKSADPPGRSSGATSQTMVVRWAPPSTAATPPCDALLVGGVKPAAHPGPPPGEQTLPLDPALSAPISAKAGWAATRWAGRQADPAWAPTLPQRGFYTTVTPDPQKDTLAYQFDSAFYI